MPRPPHKNCFTALKLIKKMSNGKGYSPSKMYAALVIPGKL